jgi:hypothetical protein
MQPTGPLHSSLTRSPRLCSVRVARSIRIPTTLGTTTLAPSRDEFALIPGARVSVAAITSVRRKPETNLSTRLSLTALNRIEGWLTNRDPRAISYALWVLFGDELPQLTGVKTARLQRTQTGSVLPASLDDVGRMPVHGDVLRRCISHRHVDEHLPASPGAPRVACLDVALQPLVAEQAIAAEQPANLGSTARRLS